MRPYLSISLFLVISLSLGVAGAQSINGLRGTLHYTDRFSEGPMLSGTFQRRAYPRLGGEFHILSWADLTPDDGDTWVAELKEGDRVLQRIELVYSAGMDCLTYNGYPINCGFQPPDVNHYVRKVLMIAFDNYCAQDVAHTISYTLPGSPFPIASDTYKPTRLPVKIREMRLSAGSIEPARVTGDAPGFADISLKVMDDMILHKDAFYYRVCERPQEKAQVRISTVISNVGDHVHFNPDDEGTGKFEVDPAYGGTLGAATKYTITHKDRAKTKEPYEMITEIKGENQPDGMYGARYNAGLFGLVEKVKFEVELPADVEGENKDANELELTIQIPYLVKMMDTFSTPRDGVEATLYAFDFGSSCGNETVHPHEAQWAIPPMMARVMWMASDYYDQFHVGLRLNDVSLKHGGLYDKGGHGTACHKSHRQGRDIDVGSYDLSGQMIDTTWEENGENMSRFKHLTDIGSRYDLTIIASAGKHFRFSGEF